MLVGWRGHHRGATDDHRQAERELGSSGNDTRDHVRHLRKQIRSIVLVSADRLAQRRDSLACHNHKDTVGSVHHGNERTQLHTSHTVRRADGYWKTYGRCGVLNG